MLSTQEVADILKTTAKAVRETAEAIRDEKPWKQFGVSGRMTMYYRSDEIDAIKSRLAEIMTGKDGKQRWVTMDGAIHETPVPYRDAVSVYRTMFGAVVLAYRDRRPAHPAIGAI